jgi:hypothetical protein
VRRLLPPLPTYVSRKVEMSCRHNSPVILLIKFQSQSQFQFRFQSQTKSRFVPSSRPAFSKMKIEYVQKREARSEKTQDSKEEKSKLGPSPS